MSNPSSLRERKKLATRQAISDVATRLFVERGFDMVTVADIAEAADVAKMTVFNYFARKEDLFFDRQDEERELFRAALAGRTAGQSPIMALGRLAHALADANHPLVRFTPSIVRFWATVDGSPALTARARELRHEFTDDLAAMLARSIGSGREADANSRLAARLFAAVWTAGYEEGLRLLRAQESEEAATATFLTTIDRGVDGIMLALRGTPYGDLAKNA